MNIQSVVELLSLEFYRFKRYKIPITLVIIEIEYKNFFEVIESHIRKTDLHQQIDKNIYAIIYSHTAKEGAYSAIRNMLDDIELKGERISLSIKEADHDDKSEQEVVEKAFAALKPYDSRSS